MKCLAINQCAVHVAVERKAGRFAFSNLPTSAVTSPVLSATEGPKVPRKFTIVSENTGVANTGGNSPSANGHNSVGSGSASGVVGAGSTTTPVTGTGSPSRSSVTEKGKSVTFLISLILILFIPVVCC